MLQIANAFFKLPGDYLLPHEEEIAGFQSRLAERLSPPPGSSIADNFAADGQEESPFDWKIHDCVAQWWRPNFETFMYPFIPAHVTRPKECKKMYLIQLPKKSMYPNRTGWWSLEILSVPKNMKLLAVPLFELYDNTARYGPQLSVFRCRSAWDWRVGDTASTFTIQLRISWWGGQCHMSHSRQR